MWPGGSRTILLVPRDPASSTLDADFLHHNDIRLKTVYDVDQALDEVRRSHPALVVREIDPSDPQAAFYDRLKADPGTAAVPLIIVATPECVGLEEIMNSDTLLRTPLDRKDYFGAVRRFVRLPQRREPRYRINLRIAFRAEGLSGQAFTRDVSMYGAFLKTDRLVPDGTRLTIAFHLPGDPEEICCEGLVHRVNSGPEEIAAGLAIEFDGLSAAGRERLQAFIDRQTACPR